MEESFRPAGEQISMAHLHPLYPMKNLTFSLILTFGIAFTSCEKAVLPDPDIQGIPFGLSGEFNGEPLGISLNNPAYKLFTSNSYNDTLWLFHSQFKPINPAQSGLPELELEFRNIEFGPDSIDIESFKRANWRIFEQNKTKTFFPLFIKIVHPDSAHHWILQLNNKLTVVNKRDHVFFLEEREQVRLNIRYENDKGVGNLTLPIRSENNQPLRQPLLNWEILQQDSVSKNATLKAVLSNNQPINDLTWNKGEKTPVITVNSPGLYGVSATDNTGRNYTHNKTLTWNPQLRSYQDPMENLEVFSHWGPPTQEPDRWQRGVIRLRIKDAMGEWYSSNTTQPGAMIEILEVKPFQKNETGDETLAMKVRISCKMKQENGNKIVALDHFTGWIAIALP
jgi:hypothetical protein